MRRRSHVRLTVPCKFCGTPFEADRVDLVMCSTKCARESVGFDTIGRWYPAGKRNGRRPEYRRAS